MTLYPDPIIKFCAGYLVVCVPCFIALLVAMKLWGEDR